MAGVLALALCSLWMRAAAWAASVLSLRETKARAVDDVVVIDFLVSTLAAVAVLLVLSAARRGGVRV